VGPPRTDPPEARERSATGSLRLFERIATPVATLILTVFLGLIVTGVINNLPRAGQGEAVTVPWLACLAGAAAFQTVLPCCVGWFALRRRKLRTYFVTWVMITFVVYYFFFVPALLYKAWARGL
jgi:ABC-type branched-subunit amino acid transport system permease subunit